MQFEAKNLWKHYDSLQTVAEVKAKRAERYSWEACKYRVEANTFSLVKDLLLHTFGNGDEIKEGKPMVKRTCNK
jgi:hypothetical protein